MHAFVSVKYVFATHPQLSFKKSTWADHWSGSLWCLCTHKLFSLWIYVFFCYFHCRIRTSHLYWSWCSLLLKEIWNASLYRTCSTNAREWSTSSTTRERFVKLLIFLWDSNSNEETTCASYLLFIAQYFNGPWRLILKIKESQLLLMMFCWWTFETSAHYCTER